MADLCDQLSEEILTEMADRFFGLRKNVDDMLEIFTASVRKLQIQEHEVVRKLAFLKYLLLQEKGAGSFFRALGIDFPSPACVCETISSHEYIPECFAWAFTAHHKYLKLVYQAYIELQKACKIYRWGDSNTIESQSDDESAPVYYQLILEMAQLINTEIEKVNSSVSPSCALAFVKRLNVVESEKEQFTGVVFDRHASGLDNALCFSPVDIAALPITAYPDLPDPQQAKKTIYRFCKAFYSENRSQIRFLMKEVTKRSPRVVT